MSDMDNVKARLHHLADQTEIIIAATASCLDNVDLIGMECGTTVEGSNNRYACAAAFNFQSVSFWGRDGLGRLSAAATTARDAANRL
jgi:hypothetical protein